MFNVKDYGAIGDGVADDTGAIQAALDATAQSGGAVLIPGGRYRLTGRLVVRSRTTILAWGAYLFGTGSHGLLRNFDSAVDSFPGYSGNSHIAVYGGIWDMRGQLAPAGTMNNCIGFSHCRNITVEGAVVRNVPGYHAIELNSTDGGRIIACRAEGFTDNSGDNSRQFSEAFQIDLAHTGSSELGPWDDTYARDIVVRDCHVGPAIDGSGLGSFGALAGSHTSVAGAYYEDIRIVGNHLDGSLSYAVRAEAWRDPIIEGNQIYGTGGTAIWVYGGLNGVIRGNTVREPGNNGVNVTGQNGMVISGNSVIKPGHRGYYLNNSLDSNVTGNHVWGGALGGVKLAAGCSGCVITNNVIRKGGGGSVAIECDAGSGTTNTVVHNRFDGYGSGASVINVSSGTINKTIPNDASLGENVA